MERRGVQACQRVNIHTLMELIKKRKERTGEMGPRKAETLEDENRKLRRQLALSMVAQRRRKPGKGLIHHSDRGSRYASNEYRMDLRMYGMTPSMSKKDDCWDNAPVELLRDSNDGVGAPPEAADKGGGKKGHLRVHRSVLQPREASLQPGISLACRLRGGNVRTTSGVTEAPTKSGEDHRQSKVSYAAPFSFLCLAALLWFESVACISARDSVFCTGRPLSFMSQQSSQPLQWHSPPTMSHHCTSPVFHQKWHSDI